MRLAIETEQGRSELTVAEGTVVEVTLRQPGKNPIIILLPAENASGTAAELKTGAGKENAAGDGERGQRITESEAERDMKKTDGAPERIRYKGTTPPARGYTGFLMVKCGYCGTVKGFCTRDTIQRFYCRACRNATPLVDLVEMWTECPSCGKSYKYMTNLKGDMLEIECLNCGAPIDLEFNSRRNGYYTISPD